MKIKHCNTCEADKPTNEFYKSKINTDGFRYKCISCENAYASAYRKTPEGQISYKKGRLKYTQSEKGKRLVRERSASYRERYPIKIKAINAVSSAIIRKKLFKGPCEVCGSTELIDGHHDDYAKPLEVRWLCMPHHMAWHKKHGEGLNGSLSGNMHTEEG